MPKAGFLSKTLKDKYTIIFIPDKKGTSKSFYFRKVFFLIPFLIIFIMLTIMSFIFSSYQKSLNNIQILQKALDDQIANINALEGLNQAQGDEIIKYNEELTKYQEEAERIRNKLKEIEELESQVKTMLNLKDSSAIPSRGGGWSVSQSLDGETDKTITKLKSMIEKIQYNTAEMAKFPSILPCSGSISSYFGFRRNPFSISSSEFHPGIDITGSYGTVIKAAADGVVTHSGWLAGYGYTVVINHGNGYETLYGHASSITVAEGKSVKKGDKVSLMGSSGRSTGVHCHFEVRYNSQPVDPLKIIKGGT